jgi:hypothetical protein
MGIEPKLPKILLYFKKKKQKAQIKQKTKILKT